MGQPPEHILQEPTDGRHLEYVLSFDFTASPDSSAVGAVFHDIGDTGYFRRDRARLSLS
jgi:hypothetical protein